MRCHIIWYALCRVSENCLPDGFQVDKVDGARVRVRVCLVEVEGVLLVAADDGVPGHPRPDPRLLDLKQPTRSDDCALGERRAHVGERGGARLGICLCGEVKNA